MTLLKRTLLLDFDGVLYSNKFAHTVIAERSTRYCNKFVKSHNNVFLDNFHRYMYKTYGHTVLGLQKLGYDATIEEYNKDVFSNINFYNMDNEWDNTHIINKMVYEMKSHDIDTYIFSNAPKCWTVPLLKQMDIHLTEDRVLELGLLKPSYELYHNVDYIFNSNIIFVDDNMINLEPVFNNTNWTKVLYANTNHILKDDLYVIDNLQRLGEIIEQK